MKILEKLKNYLLTEDYDNEVVEKVSLPVQLAAQVTGDAEGSEPVVKIAITCCVDGIGFVPVVELTCGNAAPKAPLGGGLGDDLGDGLGGDDALDLSPDKGEGEGDEPVIESTEGATSWKKGEKLADFLEANIPDKELAKAIINSKFMRPCEEMWKDARKTAEMIAKRNKEGLPTPEPLKEPDMGLPPVSPDATFAPAGELPAGGPPPGLGDDLPTE